MNTTPGVLGLNRTSDASIALLMGAEVAVAIAKERLTGIKHAWGALDDLTSVYGPALEPFDRPELVVECFSSDTERRKLDAYRRQLLHVVRPAREPVEISHHLAHVYAAFHPSPFDEAAVLVADYQGSPAALLTEGGAARSTPPEAVEIISHYHCVRGRPPVLLGKQLWDRRSEQIAGLGAFYTAVTNMMLPGIGNEGVVMGLASYGSGGELGLPPLVVDEGEVRVPERWIDELRRSAAFSYLRGGGGSFDNAVALAAATQRAYSDALVGVARWLQRRSRSRRLVFAGGCALNCSANTELADDAGFDQVWIPPAPHDGGTAIGCAVYGQVEVLGDHDVFRWHRDYLGPRRDPAQLIAALSVDARVVVEQPADLASATASLLAGGSVVALFQARSESGPRALGNRSILADPRDARTRDRINAAIKGRQWFRPLAPVARHETYERWFASPRPSPFMQFAATATAEARERLGAVVHVDGTARFQSVERCDNPFLWDLLVAFGAATGVDVLLNTSLNGPGEPIAETVEDAVALVRQRPLDALVAPPYLIRKQP